MDCSGLYWPRVVLRFMVTPGVLLWTVWSLLAKGGVTDLSNV